jgi:pimeloyl-ACP methyl ester carboxylesterase
MKASLGQPANLQAAISYYRDPVLDATPGAVVEGAGHFPHLEQPEEVNAHILAWASR